MYIREDADTLQKFSPLGIKHHYEGKVVSKF